MPKLFAVYLGGSAPGSNIELHDVQFVVAERIEAAYPDLLRLWYGLPDSLHLDSYMALEVVDGHRVSLSRAGAPGERRLYFVNLGAYQAGVFGEHHAITFMVDTDAAAVKRRAKAELLAGWDELHTDDLFELDGCAEVTAQGWRVHLEPTDEPTVLRPVNGYHPIPKPVIEAFKAGQRGS